ncbi:hypothetical protein PL371_07320 [Tenacibaculum maritimum]|nr:hypothetical protein [Tenacibaculum maritimum]MDB0611678.1 hypothetical protein [Tenacibaculum maritimum]
MNTRVKVETKDEISRIKALQKEIEQLKKLLLKKDLDAMVMDSYLEVAAEDLGYKSVNELKKAKYKGLIKAKEKSKRFASLTTITHCFGLKRDAYYKYKSRADKRLELEKQIIKIVRKRRKSLPREGVRKLVKSLDVDFNKGNIKVGRDTLFNVLRKNQMLTLRKKTSARTTNSYHRFYKYNNIIKDLEVTRAGRDIEKREIYYSFESNDTYYQKKYKTTGYYFKKGDSVVKEKRKIISNYFKEPLIKESF